MTSRAATAPRWIGRIQQRAFRHAPEDAASVVLGHSRIYVLPTRRGLAVIATLFTMLLTSLNYALSLGFVVTFLLTGLVGAALMQAFRNLAGMEIRALSAGEAFVGAAVPFTLALAGHGNERGAIVLRAPGSAAVAVDVRAEGNTPVTLVLSAATRGHVPLGRVTVSTVFPLGLWRGWAYVHFPLTGLAYPAPESGAPPVPASRSGTDEGSGGGRDDADLAGVREYKVGDPLQRVAWKAVARGAGWFTKEFDGGGGGTWVVDWNATPASLETEARLSRLCAWILASERANRPYSLRLPGTALPASLGREQRRNALSALALFEADR